MLPCVYRGNQVQPPSDENKQDHYKCQLHNICVLGEPHRQATGCVSCKDRLELDISVKQQDNTVDITQYPSLPPIGGEFARKWKDSLIVLDSESRTTHSLRNMLKGGCAFLLQGGPSANQLPLERLNNRGCFTLAVNNAVGHPKLRPQAFVCSDPSYKFTHCNWLDPGIMKFVPSARLVPKLGRVARKLPNGEFIWINDRYATNSKHPKLAVRDCPNVWGFMRRSWMRPDDSFFLEDHAAWGNQDSGIRVTGEAKTVNTAFLGIRLLRYLGASRIFLLGADFYMDPTKGDIGNYSFAESRNSGECESNNRQFKIAVDWLCRMQDAGVFERFGLAIYNCAEESGLTAFPHVPFNTAVDLATAGIENTPDLTGWYAKSVDRAD